MHKEKSKKSEHLCEDFPAGQWFIKFGLEDMPDYPWDMGLINLIEIEGADPRFIGAIQFSGDVKTVDNKPFPLHVEFLDGAIHFHIMGSTQDFDPINDPYFHFKFDGVCEMVNNEIVLSGTGGVPASFVPDTPSRDKAKSHRLRADGDSVIWLSKNPVEPPDKHSK